jgi:hypothetical protein
MRLACHPPIGFSVEWFATNFPANARDRALFGLKHHAFSFMTDTDNMAWGAGVHSYLSFLSDCGANVLQHLMI